MSKNKKTAKTFFSFLRLSANIPGNIFYLTMGMSEDDIHVKIAPTSAEQQAVYWLNGFNLLQFLPFFPITFGKTFSPCAAVCCHFEGNQYFSTVSCTTCVCAEVSLTPRYQCCVWITFIANSKAGGESRYDSNLHRT